MEKHIYPIRSFIRFQAKQRLMSEAYVEHVEASSPFPSMTASSSSPAELNAAEGRQHNPMYFDTTAVDNGLLTDIATTLFNSDRYPELYRPCTDIVEATAIEDAIALEIVATYHRIKQNRQRADVQSLNKLL